MIFGGDASNYSGSIQEMYISMPIPDLEQCKEAYRYVYRLLSVQRHVDLEEWLHQPAFF
ncbi:hypothetical protein QUF99_13670 [Bacillus sp. DX4.1]|uniref:hypothetical protein n=1 Tax=Bacillus sp. DX4.1 TaxID=3055867 RepID=UPI0025A0B4FF|nr:hypothetical protein [Bacillus sp. DX4.1]MDM5188330.1 hypothetical protein [Bacillus sp. DX4.1]